MSHNQICYWDLISIYEGPILVQNAPFEALMGSQIGPQQARVLLSPLPFLVVFLAAVRTASSHVVIFITKRAACAGGGKSVLLKTLLQEMI